MREPVKSLTQPELYAMQEDIAQGMTEREAASKYGCSAPYVHRHKSDKFRQFPIKITDVVEESLITEASLSDPCNTFNWTTIIEDKVLNNIAVGILPSEMINEKFLPNATQVRYHCLQSPGFAARYERALSSTADALVIESISILKSEPERMLTKEGDKIDPSWVAWTRIKIDTMLRVASYINPKRYGAKIDIEQISQGAIDDETAIDPKLYTDAELQTLISLLERKSAR